MSDMPRKPRGKGRKPTLVFRSIRMPRDVLEYYETTFPNASQKMREVLTAYKEFKTSSAWAVPLDHKDKEELE